MESNECKTDNVKILIKTKEKRSMKKRLLSLLVLSLIHISDAAAVFPTVPLLRKRQRASAPLAISAAIRWTWCLTPSTIQSLWRFQDILHPILARIRTTILLRMRPDLMWMILRRHLSAWKAVLSLISALHGPCMWIRREIRLFSVRRVLCASRLPSAGTEQWAVQWNCIRMLQAKEWRQRSPDVYKRQPLYAPCPYSWKRSTKFPMEIWKRR